jgi:Na+-translocating ferredoxin:NAD+ oxidoreductase RnfD subunit
VCAAIEVAIALWREGVLLWPASALLTGNSVAFIMRSSGTRHGDWWSLSGIEVFVVACVLSMLSKHLLRRQGRHVFNPSNLGLVAAFVLFGTKRANPQDLWWGALSPGLWLTLAVIAGGGLLVARRLRMLGLVVAFWLTFAAAVGVVAASGHCITARWHYTPVCGGEFWSVMTTSPELLVFLFFMVTDPRTAPSGTRARIAYGAAVAFVAALLAAPLQTEFATKVAVLDGLVVVCGVLPLVPLLRRVPRGRVVAGAGAVAAAGALLLASMPARGAAAAAAAHASGGLPRAVAPAGARPLPPISVTAEARATVPGLDDAEAHAAVAAAMAHAAAAPNPPARVEGATLLMLRKPDDAQAPPQLGVELRGSTAAGTGWAREFIVTGVDGRWAVTAERPPG